MHGGVANDGEVELGLHRAPRSSRPSAGRARSSSVDGILVPGGFGERGIEGKIAAIRYAREHEVPFFGICLGMQCR